MHSRWKTTTTSPTATTTINAIPNKAVTEKLTRHRISKQANEEAEAEQRHNFRGVN